MKSALPKDLARWAPDSHFVIRDNLALSLFSLFGNLQFTAVLIVLSDTPFLSRRLARSEKWRVREIVAKYTEFPEVKEIFMKDPHNFVRAAVISNHLEEEQILSFAKDSSAKVRAAVVQYTSSEEVRASFLTDKSSQVRRAVAQHTTSQPLLEQLSEDSSADVRTSVATRSQDEKVLNRLQGDIDEDVAEHASLSLTLLQRRKRRQRVPVSLT